jgi:hypothetical protein
MAKAAEGSNGTVWYSASRCANGECVEVASRDAAILIRDSKDPAGAVLTYSVEEWAAFIAGVKAGEFDMLGA